jgi:hypothetical protein
LKNNGDLSGAEAEFREAIRIDPTATKCKKELTSLFNTLEFTLIFNNSIKIFKIFNIYMMNVDFESKYLKYKTKYEQLINNNVGGGDFTVVKLTNHRGQLIDCWTWNEDEPHMLHKNGNSIKITGQWFQDSNDKNLFTHHKNGIIYHFYPLEENINEPYKSLFPLINKSDKIRKPWRKYTDMETAATSFINDEPTNTNKVYIIDIIYHLYFLGNNRHAATTVGNNRHALSSVGNNRHAATTVGNNRHAATTVGNNRHAATTVGNNRHAATTALSSVGNNRHAATTVGNNRHAATTVGNKRHASSSVGNNRDDITDILDKIRNNRDNIDTVQLQNPDVANKILDLVASTYNRGFETLFLSNIKNSENQISWNKLAGKYLYKKYKETMFEKYVLDVITTSENKKLPFGNYVFVPITNVINYDGKAIGIFIKDFVVYKNVEISYTINKNNKTIEI